jgi:hypothetical protein
MSELDVKERLAKMPLWLQEHVSGLETRISSLEGLLREMTATAEAGPAESNVFAEIGDTERPLGRDVEVSFKTDRQTYTVGLQPDGALLVDAAVDVLVEPLSTFSLMVRSKG